MKDSASDFSSAESSLLISKMHSAATLKVAARPADEPRMAAMARIALCAAVVAVLAALAVAPAEANQDTTAKQAAQTSRALGDILESLARHSGKGDPDYLTNGIWHSGDRGYWSCNVGAGTAAAVL